MLAAAVLVAARPAEGAAAGKALGGPAPVVAVLVAEPLVAGRRRRAVLPETGHEVMPVAAVLVEAAPVAAALLAAVLVATGRPEVVQAVVVLAVTPPVVTLAVARLTVVRLAAAAKPAGRAPAETVRRAATGRADRPRALPAHGLAGRVLPGRLVPEGVRVGKVPPGVARQTAALVEVGARGPVAPADTAGAASAARDLKEMRGAGQTVARALIAVSTVRAG